MPEKTSTGKWVFPIRRKGDFKKEGWFQRDTNTAGVAVRLARLKSTGNTVVQAYIFDTAHGWTVAKIKKWLRAKGVKWLQSLDETLADVYKGDLSTVKGEISIDDTMKTDAFKKAVESSLNVKMKLNHKICIGVDENCVKNGKFDNVLPEDDEKIVTFSHKK